jgi:hypothetical protein
MAFGLIGFYGGRFYEKGSIKKSMEERRASAEQSGSLENTNFLN